MPHVSSNSKREWLLGAVLFLFSCLVYLPAIKAGFIWDDVVMVTDNHSLRNLSGLRDIWTTTKTTDVYPITFSMLWVEWQLWGANPLGYHVVNVLLHAAGAVLLWRLLKQLMIPAAWAGAILFALHPVGVASVAWISERKNTLSFVFFLLTLLSFIRFQNRGERKWYFLSIVAFLCALASKTSVVMLPFVLLLITWWNQGKLQKKDWFRAAPFFALSLVFGLITIWNQYYHAIGDSAPQHQNWIERAAGAGCAVLFYLWKDLFPVQLNVIYPRWELRASNPLIYLPLILLLAVMGIAWKKRDTWGRHLLFGIGYFVLVLFPVMGFFDMYFLTFSRVADHLQHLALAGIIPFFTAVAYWLMQRERLPKFLPAVTGATVAILLAFSTWTRASVYENEEKLWTDTVRKNPQAWMAYNNLGNALFARKQLAEAEAAYQSALAVNPDFPDAHSNLGNLLVEKRELDAAVDHLLKATSAQTNNAKFHFNLGVALGEQKKYAQALQSYERALRIRPRYAEVHNNMANLLLKQNKHQEALAHALAAVAINPNSPEAQFNAAEAQSNLGQNSEAISHYQMAIQLRPGFVAAHYSMGILFAMNNQVINALPHFEEAARLKPNDPILRTALGNAYAVTKQLPKAISEYQSALSLDMNNAEAHANLANALSESGRALEAFEHYSASLKLDPTNVNAYFNFGLILEKQGKRQDALTQYQAALRLRPNDAMIQRQIKALTNN